MRISRDELALLIEIIFEWDKWRVLENKESSLDSVSFSEVKPLFRKMYSSYWDKEGV